MRILFHTAPPQMPTGYATQAGLIIPRLAALGHEVAVSASAGIESHQSRWRNFKVYGKTPYADFGEDVIQGHARDFGADLVITFLCTWILNPLAWRDLRVIHLTPVDCEPMSVRDYRVISGTGGTPAAVSRWGAEQMKARGLPDPLYLPHGVDTAVFSPAADRDGLRKASGADGKFVVGMNFMNNDKFRKNIPEQIRAFARFHETHPDSILAIHAIHTLPEGYSLPAMCQHFGIEDAVIFSPQYELVTGMISAHGLADWYSICDVVLECGNEGFGLCRLESQACGTPLITGNWGTGPELNALPPQVSGELVYNDVHQADWHRPSVADITAALTDAYDRGDAMREKVREHALGWDIDRIIAEHWGPVLDDLT